MFSGFLVIPIKDTRYIRVQYETYCMPLMNLLGRCGEKNKDIKLNNWFIPLLLMNYWQKNTKMTVYKSTFLPIHSHYSELWTFTSKHKSRIKSIKVDYHCKMVGMVWWERIRNSTIRTGLKVKLAETILEEHKLRWFRHLHKMDQEDIWDQWGWKEGEWKTAYILGG